MDRRYSHIGNRLRELRGNKTQTEFANELNMTLRSYQYFESGERAPRMELLARIAEMNKVSADWLISGEIHKPMNTASFGDDYILIKQATDSISAGIGTLPYNQFEMNIAFRREWIQKKGNPKDMSLIKVKGDSMENTFFANDVVLVNHSLKSIAPEGGIYAIAIDDHIMVKRLQLLWAAKKVQIISDNPKYKTLEVEESKIKINGKIIWLGHEIEK